MRKLFHSLRPLQASKNREIRETFVPFLREQINQLVNSYGNSMPLLASISDEVLENLMKVLHSIPRWGEGDETPPYLETNADHGMSLFEELDIFLEKCPEIKPLIDIPRLKVLFMIHDLGECGRGDIPNDPELDISPEEKEKMKGAEVCWGKWAIRQLKKIDDSISDETVTYLIDVFIAYEFRNLKEGEETNNPYHKKLTDDQKSIIRNKQPTLQLMKLLDYIQALKKGDSLGLFTENFGFQPLGIDHGEKIFAGFEGALGENNPESLSQFKEFILSKHKKLGLMDKNRVL